MWVYFINKSKGDNTMGLFDCINDVQVHCFRNNLSNYKTGDKISLKTKSYRYPENVMFLQTIYPGIKPYEKKIHIIKDSTVQKTVEIGDLKKDDFENIEGVFTDTGKILNIHSYDNLINFLYEDCKLQLDLDFLIFNMISNEDLYNKRSKLENEFYEKWYL